MSYNEKKIYLTVNSQLKIVWDNGYILGFYWKYSKIINPKRSEELDQLEKKIIQD